MLLEQSAKILVKFRICCHFFNRITEEQHGLCPQKRQPVEFYSLMEIMETAIRLTYIYYTPSKLPSRISMFGTKTAFRGSNLQKEYDEREHDNRRERQNYFRQKRRGGAFFTSCRFRWICTDKNSRKQIGLIRFPEFRCPGSTMSIQIVYCQFNKQSIWDCKLDKSQYWLHPPV